jgi:hypothetical protein
MVNAGDSSPESLLPPLLWVKAIAQPAPTTATTATMAKILMSTICRSPIECVIQQI